MSRVIDWNKQLSDDDRRWALDRGMYAEVALNDEQHGVEREISEYELLHTTGILGTEPSSQGDRVGLEELGRNPAVRDVHTDHTGTPLWKAQPEPEPESDEYEEMSKDDLLAEVRRRNADRDPDEHLALSGNKSDLVARLRADDKE